MIRSFSDKTTEDLYHGRQTSRARRFPDEIRPTALRKLDSLNAAHALRDLTSPPGNRLKKLSGDLASFHSIRINDQWRITFRWIAGNVEDVQITGYHS